MRVARGEGICPNGRESDWKFGVINSKSGVEGEDGTCSELAEEKCVELVRG